MVCYRFMVMVIMIVIMVVVVVVVMVVMNSHRVDERSFLCERIGVRIKIKIILKKKILF